MRAGGCSARTAEVPANASRHCDNQAVVRQLAMWLSALRRLARGVTPPQFTAYEVRSPSADADVPVAEDVLVMHKFVFDVGRPVDPLEGAQRLLSSDIATVAVHAASGQIINALREAELRRTTARAQEMLDTAALLQEERSFPRLVWFLVRRPRVLSAVVRAWRHRNDEVPDDEPGPSDDEGDNFRLEDVDGLVLEQALLIAIQHDIDGKVLRPQYLQSDPWIRIELQPCFLTHGNGEEYAVDVVLVLHRTGTAVLTFYLMHHGPLATDELTKRMMSVVPVFSETEMASAIVEIAAAASGAEPRPVTEERHSSGVRWSRWHHRRPSSLAHIFENYADAIRAVVNARNPARPRVGDAHCYTGEWHSYSVTSVRKPHPDLRSDGPLAIQLGAVASRNPEWKTFKPDYLRKIAADDWSKSTDRSYWFNEATALLVHTRNKYESLHAQHDGDIPGQDWIFPEQYYAVLFDLLLVQYHTVLALNRQVEHVNMSPHQVEGLKARILVARTDLAGESHFSYGDLRELERRFHDLRGIPRYWDDIADKLRLVDDVLESINTERRFRSNRALQAVVGVAAIFVGAPAVSDSVERLANVEGLGAEEYLGAGRLVNEISDVAATSSGPITVAVTVALLVLLFLVFARGRRPRRTQKTLADSAVGPTARGRLYQYFPGSQVYSDVKNGQSVVHIGPYEDRYAKSQDADPSDKRTAPP